MPQSLTLTAYIVKLLLRPELSGVPAGSTPDCRNLVNMRLCRPRLACLAEMYKNLTHTLIERVRFKVLRISERWPKKRLSFGELVDLVRYRGDTVVLVKSDQPAAALVPIEWLERYRKDRAAAFRVVADVRAQNEDISEAELQTLINESIQAVRQQKR